MLEDESGRVQLVGDALRRIIDENEDGPPSESGWSNLLVTGVIMAALGHETSSGEFEVMDFCFAGMAPMMLKPTNVSEDMDIDGNASRALISERRELIGLYFSLIRYK